jgi:plasmid maintenance system killer protein
MDILFRDAKLKKLCSNQKNLARPLGKDQSQRLLRRLDQLRAATVLEDLRNAPGRCHELTKNRAGQLSLDLVHPDRLIFEPADQPIPVKDDGGLDWSQVAIVEIVGIVDTHE